MAIFTDKGTGLTDLRIHTMDRVEAKLFIEVENTTTKKGFIKFLTLEKAEQLRDFLNENFPKNEEGNTNAEANAAVGGGK